MTDMLLVKTNTGSGRRRIPASHFIEGVHELWTSGPTAPAPITRETIDTMNKADLIDLLSFHGADTEGTIKELRIRLTGVMFI